jgi:hypothetical protein
VVHRWQPCGLGTTVVDNLVAVTQDDSAVSKRPAAEYRYLAVIYLESKGLVDPRTVIEQIMPPQSKGNIGYRRESNS